MPGPRRRAVLALLAVTAPDTLSAEGLVDAVWGDEPTDVGAQLVAEPESPACGGTSGRAQTAWCGATAATGCSSSPASATWTASAPIWRRHGRGSRRSERRRRPPAPGARRLARHPARRVRRGGAPRDRSGGAGRAPGDRRRRVLRAAGRGRTAGRRDRAGVADGGRCAAARAQPAPAHPGAGRRGPGPRCAPPRHGVPTAHGRGDRPRSRHRPSPSSSRRSPPASTRCPGGPRHRSPAEPVSGRRPPGARAPDPRSVGRAGASSRSSSPSSGW